jgi:hypothetical protein
MREWHKGYFRVDFFFDIQSALFLRTARKYGEGYIKHTFILLFFRPAIQENHTNLNDKNIFNYKYKYACE